ncbi:MAG: farnesyl-diphosphate synthase [Moraxellaceae bacterium]|jgi:undecaprenyl diphosphate synthase|nr:farnesyl-diphosphate synthase [Moraxellaceae bacterium]MDF3031492.1 farnesyl-diphosphate synthase [Moraxellaceae bacterium]
MTASVPSSAPDLESVSGTLPRHVAIIMDGNNRWAKRRGLPGPEGHKAGESAVRRIVEHAARSGIEVLTVFAFSSENWRRPESEVAALMSLFLEALTKKVGELHQNGIRLRFIGDLSRFSPELQSGMQEAVHLTRDNVRMTLVIAVNYGGQWDMAHAAQRLAIEVAEARLTPAEITPERMGHFVQMADLPPVDLLIRTGGEMRISNFLLWQTAYAEFYFTDALWPDFDAAELDRALADYSGRQRRFGRTSEQVEATAGDA